MAIAAAAAAVIPLLGVSGAAHAATVAQVGNSSVYAVQGPNNSQDFYRQTIGTSPWNCEQVTGIGGCLVA